MGDFTDCSLRNPLVSEWMVNTPQVMVLHLKRTVMSTAADAAEMKKLVKVEMSKLNFSNAVVMSYPNKWSQNGTPYGLIIRVGIPKKAQMTQRRLLGTDQNDVKTKLRPSSGPLLFYS